jgi:hypothetical protein
VLADVLVGVVDPGHVPEPDDAAPVREDRQVEQLVHRFGALPDRHGAEGTAVSTIPASRMYSSSWTRWRTRKGDRPRASTRRASISISSRRSRPPLTSTSFTPWTWLISGAITSWTWARRASGVYGPVTVYSRNGRCCSRNSRGT